MTDLVFFAVAYNPEENLFQNVIRAKSEGYRVCVYLNRVSSKDLNRLQDLEVELLGENTNVGLGIAFFELEKMLLSEGKARYIYFDQDTIVESETLSIIKNRSANDLVGQGAIFYTSDKVTSYRSGFVPSSGCLFHISEPELMHDRELYVECVDYEYCIRLKTNRQPLKVISIPGIDHCSLQDGASISLFGRVFYYRVYPASRVLDFNRSHFKLLKMVLCSLDLRSFFFLTRSLVLFNVNNVKSKLFEVFKCSFQS
ncbi:TPA: hypothetical protein I7680_07555 [Vibrio vulnificus]|nr:hypothetical protein [Vibrio vulnificus]HAS8445442.1 hypothetical protein [Vibrio vulnificus]HAS8454897.1 hypothetical protein [Vibrio vulnificus]HDY7725108.1 hypothetical protein [Vibrio vulnificus]